MIRTTLALAFLTLGTTSAASPLQHGTPDNSELPSAAHLFARHVEATGGVEAHSRHRTRIKEGKLAVDVAGHSFVASTTEKFLAPDKSHVTIDGDFFFQVSVCDGERAWEWNAGHDHGEGGPNLDSGTTSVLKGERADRARNKARFRAALEWKDRYPEARTVGLVDLDGAPAHEVRIKPEHGKPYSQFYDQRTGRLVQRNRTVLSAMGEEVEMEVRLEDYKEFDGVWYAMTVRALLRSSTFGEGTQVWTYSEVRHGEKIAPTLFELPEDLRSAHADSAGAPHTEGTKRAGDGSSGAGGA